MFRISRRRQGNAQPHTPRFGRPRTGPRYGRGHRPALEWLEDRALPSFLPVVSYDVGGEPFAVAAADLTGTGTLDLVTTNTFPNSVAVLLGNGDGTFQPHANYPANVNRGAVDAGDLNGDGITDLVVTNYTGAGTVSILLGNGDGTFQDAQTLDAGSLPTDVAVADLTGNGIADLVTANASDEVLVFRGNGDGTFQAPVAYAAGSYPVAVAVEDLNGDGIPDLAVADEAPTGGTRGVSILLGNGDGTFQAPVVYPVTGFPQYVEAGDFTGDGIPDLVTLNLEGTANGSTVSFFQGNGDGTFRSPVSYDAGGFQTYGLAAGDFNGDGSLDVAVTDFDSNKGQVNVLLNNGDGSFQAPQGYSTGSVDPLGVTAGDFNGDGSVDLATANAADGTVSVLINAADWSAPARHTGALKAGAQAGANRAAGVTDGLAEMPTDPAPWAQLAAKVPGVGLANVDHFFASQNGPATTGRPDIDLSPAASADRTGQTVAPKSAPDTLLIGSGHPHVADPAFGKMDGADNPSGLWTSPW